MQRYHNSFLDIPSVTFSVDVRPSSEKIETEIATRMGLL